jgi:hypothetical protein
MLISLLPWRPFHRLADVCAARQISIELFVNGEANEFVDAATLGKLTHTTAGAFHLYKGPIASPATGLKFAMDVRRALTKRVANETVLKVRCGLTPFTDTQPPPHGRLSPYQKRMAHSSPHPCPCIATGRASG